ncbi:hypothetical protein FALCPG4_014262 [Fusarium falciforme]
MMAASIHGAEPGATGGLELLTFLFPCQHDIYERPAAKEPSGWITEWTEPCGGFVRPGSFLTLPCNQAGSRRWSKCLLASLGVEMKQRIAVRIGQWAPSRPKPMDIVHGLVY